LCLIKVAFHNYINNHKDTVFEGGARVMLERLSKAANVVGHDISKILDALAEKVCLATD